MDLAVLKKKISSYKTASGRLTKVPDDLTLEILQSWEHWTGPASDFYSEIGVSAKKMARVIGRGKELKREGHFTEEFKEIAVEGAAVTSAGISGHCGIELVWKDNVIRFGDTSLLLDFLKRRRD
ncbi:MAG: hypothetical protein HYV97_06945 [Bdellovibrio sp.]|nr:hypothetical protein [Bdellovibrio sp.]